MTATDARQLKYVADSQQATERLLTAIAAEARALHERDLAASDVRSTDDDRWLLAKRYRDSQAHRDEVLEAILKVHVDYLRESVDHQPVPAPPQQG